MDQKRDVVSNSQSNQGEGGRDRCTKGKKKRRKTSKWMNERRAGMMGGRMKDGRKDS